MPAVLHLPTGKALTIQSAADVFLDSLGNPNTLRNYGIAVGKTVERLGVGRPLASVVDERSTSRTWTWTWPAAAAR